MKITRQLVLFFAIAGLFPALFFEIQDLIVEDAPLTINFFYSILVSVTVTVSISLVVCFILFDIQKRVPWEKGVVKRLVVVIITTYPIVIGMMLLFTPGMYWVEDCEDTTSYTEFQFYNIVVGMIMNTLLVAITEGISLFTAWKRSLLEKERLEHEHLRSQYESLKNQVNPHFLFNSLSVLSSLVHSDQNKAGRFIDEFARIYRYVLEVKDKRLVPLAEELGFIESYIYLQKIRFGENLKISMDIPEDYKECFIPPLALQMLMENAIKHNHVSREHPLHIKVEGKDFSLIVTNNLRVRELPDNSTGIGLKNLEERYALLGSHKPVIEKTDSHYQITIALIQPEHESIDR